MAAERFTGLSGVSIRRPVFTSMLAAALVVLGVFGWRRLGIDMFPSIDFPVVAVQTIYPGASSETVEREVTRRLEEVFNPVAGVDQITSVSLEGVSQVIVMFDLDVDVDVAAADVRAKIEGVRRELPGDIEPPVIQKFDPGAIPILSLALSSETAPIESLTVLADETIRRRLEGVRGVGEVRLAGGLAREIRVNLLPARLEALGVTVPDVMGALRMQNMEVPAGRVESGASEQLVRVIGRITDPRQFDEIIVATRHGQPVRLREVARVEIGTEDERSVAFVNGRRAVAMDLLKVSGSNTVAVAHAVLDELSRLDRELPKGMELRVIRNDARYIEQSVNDVIHELELGALLTVLVVMLFLNDWKATAITSFALPVSVISSFILMYALNFTINFITLLALSLSIGILIDDAIVVIENIVRHRQKGEDHFTAAGRGTHEIFLAVMATTLSIVAVFVPVAFMGGIVGRFFYQFGLTVAWAVLVSLFVSFTLTPMLSAWWGVNPHVHGAGTGNVLTRTIARFNAWFDRRATDYRRVVLWALTHRKSTLGIAAAAFVGAFLLMPFIGGGFMPASDQSEFSITFRTPEGSSLGYTKAKAAQIESLVRGLGNVSHVYTTVGAGMTGTVTTGETYVAMVPAAERPVTQAQFMVQVREALARVHGINAQVVEAGGFGGAQAPIQLQIRGAGVDELQRLSDQLMIGLRRVPQVTDLRSSLGAPKPELRVAVNRDVANKIGVDVGQIAGTIRPLMAGQVATRWEDASGEERDVVVQVPPELRRSLQDIASIPIAVSERVEGRASLVRLADVARIDIGTAPSQIDRFNLERVATISGSPAEGSSLSEASAAIQAEVDKLKMPAGYSARFAGETEIYEETVGYVLESMLLAIILIFLILASQFESYTQPIAIMISLPLSLVGVLLALLVTNDTLNMMSMIGVIMLMGLVTKNAILLVDNANEKRAGGMQRYEALVEAGAVRLRPIMMTTLAMIFGMLPIALALGEGGGFRAPMARAVIGGLITSTMLTLLVVPVAYTYFDDFGAWVKHRLVSSKDEEERERELKVSGAWRAPVWGELEEVAADLEKVGGSTGEIALPEKRPPAGAAK